MPEPKSILAMGIQASAQDKGSKQVYYEEYRRDLELRVRNAMAENPGISLNRLREVVHCANATLGTIYNRVRRGE